MSHGYETTSSSVCCKYSPCNSRRFIYSPVGLSGAKLSSDLKSLSVDLCKSFLHRKTLTSHMLPFPMCGVTVANQQNIRSISTNYPRCHHSHFENRISMSQGYRASVVHPEHVSEYVRWTETRILWNWSIFSDISKRVHGLQERGHIRKVFWHVRLANGSWERVDELIENCHFLSTSSIGPALRMTGTFTTLCLNSGGFPTFGFRIR